MNKAAQRKAAKLSILAKIYMRLCIAQTNAKEGCGRSMVEAIQIGQQLHAVKQINSKILKADGRIDKRRQRRFEPWCKNSIFVSIKTDGRGYDEQS